MFLRKHLFQGLGKVPKTQENLTSGKIIPTSRMKPYASPQVGKVSPEFVNKKSSPEDEKSSDTNDILKHDCLDALIEHPDSKNVFEKAPRVCFQTDCSLQENLHNTPCSEIVSWNRYFNKNIVGIPDSLLLKSFELSSLSACLPFQSDE